ncbi:hypothetical protein ACKBNH_004243 [Vibrio vulnificus]|nr:hypothetical protein [Vibrio vulnificus]EJS4046470.1 hypothetical protein [Vibrio vulnificus]HDY8127890.1 hypothetical protein [Vibrio vulnificus]HDZ3276642.1 hypothetical protein [Vibrio vulnificus]
MNKHVLAACIIVPLIWGCGGGDGGGSSSSSTSDTQASAPYLKAPSDLVMNVRAEGSLEALATTSDGKEANVEWIWISGPKVINQNRDNLVTFWAPKDPGQSIYKLVAKDPVSGTQSSETIRIEYHDIDARTEQKNNSNNSAIGYIPKVGSGVDTELNTTKVNSCTTGFIKNTPHPQITTKQELVFNVDEIFRKFSASMSGGIGLEKIVASAAMSYENEEKSRAANASYILKIGMIQGYDQLVFEDDEVGKLKEEALNELKTNWGRFRSLCGNAVISQQLKGANLYIALTVQFNNSYEKESFEATSDAKVLDIVSMSRSLSYLKESVSSNIKTQLTMFAEGGDVSLALKALPSNDAFLDCSNDYDKCIAALSTLQNTVQHTSDYAASITAENSVVIASTPTVYGDVAFNVELSDILLSDDEREAINNTSALLRNEYSYQSYVDRFDVQKLSEEDYNKNKLVADQFNEDKQTIRNRVAIAKSAYISCMRSPMQCDSTYSKALDDLDAFTINNPTWPFILQRQTPKGPTYADVWCLPPTDRNWGIVDIGPAIFGDQYYEANLVYMKLREIKDDRTLGDLQFYRCHQEGSSTPITKDVGKGGQFVSENQIPAVTRWLNNPNNDYFLTKLITVAGAGKKNDNRWLYHGGVFTKYENGYLIPYWNNKLAWIQSYSNIVSSIPYSNVPTESSNTQSTSAPGGGWLNGISFTRNKGGNYPMASWPIVPFN